MFPSQAQNNNNRAVATVGQQQQQQQGQDAEYSKRVMEQAELLARQMIAQYMQQSGAGTGGIPIQIGGSMDPNRPLSIEDFDQNTPRTLIVTLKGSLNDFATGKKAAEWRPRTLDIFKRIEGYAPDGTPKYKGDTSKGIILVMKQRALQSSYPIMIGATCDFMQGTHVTDTGEHFLFTAAPHTNWSNGDKCLFQPKDPISRAALEQYNSVSLAAVLSGVYIGIDGMALVPNNGPIGKMLHHNQKLLQLDFQGLHPSSEGMLSVSQNIVEQCVDTYRRIQTVSFKNLNEFVIKFSRVGAPWTAADGLLDNLAPDGRNANNRKSAVHSLYSEIDMRLVLYGDELEKGEVPLVRVTGPYF